MLLSKRGFYHPVAILVLAAITLSFAAIFYLNSSVFFKAPEKSPQPETTTSPSPTSQKSSIDETTGWKIYRNEEAKFQIKYPPEWVLKFLDESGNPDSTLVGKEGKIQFIWGEGLGGGCDRNFENILLKNGSVPSCHIVDNQTEMWVGFTPDNTSVDTRAYVNKPLETNRMMVLKILETYESVE